MAMSKFGNAAMSRLSMLSPDPQGESDAYGEVLPVRLIATSDIDPHPDNRDVDAGHVGRLADDIAEIGLGQYVLVRPLSGAPGRYQCIVGHHRVEAFKLLAGRDPEGPWGKIPCVVCDYDDARTERMLVDSNLHSRPLSREELGREMLRLKPMADRMREQDPERYRGARTAEIMRDIYNEGAEPGSEISTRTVERSISSARAADAAKVADVEPASDRSQETPERPEKTSLEKAEAAARRAAAALSRKLEALYGEIGDGAALDAASWAKTEGELGRARALADAIAAKRAAGDST